MVAADEPVPVAGSTGDRKDPENKGPSPGSFVGRIRGHPWFYPVIAILIVVAAVAGIFYWIDLQSKVYVENSRITAPEIAINPTGSGIIDKVYVSVGDEVYRNQWLAKVGNEILRAKTNGVITGVENAPGKMVNPLINPTPVISMIDTRQLRVTGQVQEDKGLQDIRPGQYVIFTVDAYPANRYEGTVEKVAQSAREGDVVFSISEKRQEQKFDVTVIYDVTAYPELKEGMSAKMWVYK
jgi:multidrug resistance efflux pump